MVTWMEPSRIYSDCLCISYSGICQEKHDFCSIILLRDKLQNECTSGANSSMYRRKLFNLILRQTYLHIHSEKLWDTSKLTASNHNLRIIVYICQLVARWVLKAWVPTAVWVWGRRELCRQSSSSHGYCPGPHSPNRPTSWTCKDNIRSK
jgi:hypothetical protein